MSDIAQPYVVPQPDLRPIPGTETYLLRAEWVCWLPFSGKWLTIKAGFVFDGASIPRLLWSWAYPFDPNWVAAALAHDGLYAAELLTKNGCDKELFHLMRLTSPEGAAKARTFFIAVDLFGSWVWKKHTEKSILDARTECFISDTPPADATKGTAP